MSIIAQAEVAKVACDKTVTCTIIDDTNKTEGKYRVSDGSTEFYAYSDNTTYANNNVVYVTIPNGDYTQQKIITGKYTEDSDEPYIYTKPFDTFLPCSPNIVTNGQKVGLEANVENLPEDAEALTNDFDWEKNTYEKIYKPVYKYSQVSAYNDKISDYYTYTKSTGYYTLIEALAKESIESTVKGLLSKRTQVFVREKQEGQYTQITETDPVVSLEECYGSDEDTTKSTQIGYWNKDQLNRYYKDFNRLGVQADFQSLLSQENIQKGDYGLKLDIEYQVGQQEQYPREEVVKEYQLVDSLQGQYIQFDNYDLIIHEGEIFNIVAECEVLEETEDYTCFRYNLTFSSIFRDYSFKVSTNSEKISSEEWGYIIFNFDTNDIENVDVKLKVAAGYIIKPKCDLLIITDSAEFRTTQYKTYDFGMEEFEVINKSLLISGYTYNCYNFKEIVKAATTDQNTGYSADTYYTTKQSIDKTNEYTISDSDVKKDNYKNNNYYKIPFTKDTSEYPTENRLYYAYDSKSRKYTEVSNVISYLDGSLVYYNKNEELITLSEAYKGQYVYRYTYIYEAQAQADTDETIFNKDKTSYYTQDTNSDEFTQCTDDSVYDSEITYYKKIRYSTGYYVYKPDTLYYIPEEYYNTEAETITTVLATENGFDSDKTYYSLNLIKLDVNRDNYTSLVSNGQVGIFNDKNELIQETLDKNFTAAKNKYKDVDWYKKTGGFVRTSTVDINNYQNFLGKIYQKEQDGSHTLVTDNGYDSSVTYCYKTYQMVDVTDNDDVSEYYTRKIKDKTYTYSKATGTANANTQYYEEKYLEIAITKDQYKPGIFYKKDEDTYELIEDNGYLSTTTYWLPEYTLVEKKDTTNEEFDEGLYYYKYTYTQYESGSTFVYKKQEDFNSYDWYEKDKKNNTYTKITDEITKDNYKNYYYGIEIDNYYPIIALGFDETIDYYDYNIFANNPYVKANVTEENYKPGTYYSTKNNYLTKTACVYLNTDEMLGQPYAYASPQTQEIVYDISDVNDILSMSLYFYEDNQFVKSTSDRYIPTGNDNLFVDNVKIYFGQDISDIDENNNDYVQLFTYNGDTYKATSNSAENDKTIYLKWVHREGDKNYIIDVNNEAALFEDEEDEAVKTFEIDHSCKPTKDDDDEFTIKLDTSNDQIEGRHYYTVTEKQAKGTKDSNLVYYTRSFVQNGALEYDATKEYYSLTTITTAEYDENTDIIEKSYKSMSYVQVTDQTNLEPLRKYYRPCEAGGSYIYVGIGATVSLTEGDLYYQNYEVATDETDEIIAYQVYRKLNSADVKAMNANRKYIYYSKIVAAENEDVPDDLDNSSTKYYQRSYIREDDEEGFVYSPSTYYYVSVNTENVEIRWYRYELGAAAADEYSGVYWTRIDPNWSAEDGKNAYLADNFTLLLEPDAVYNETEKIKVIIIYGETTATSNILEFTNESPVANLPTLQQENALRVSYSDGTLGNYYVYGEDNQLLSSDEAQETRTIKLLFDLEDFTSSSLLTSAESVEWIFPTTKTMISVDTSATAGVYSENNGIGTIKNTISDASEYSLTYTINGYYSYSLNNNTIICNVYKDGILYSTSAQFSFGQSGSNGTEYTLELDLQEPDGVVTIGGASSSEGLYYLTFGEIAKKYWEANSDIQLYNRVIDAEGYINYEPISIAEATAQDLDSLYALNTYTKIGYETPNAADYIAGEYKDKNYYIATINNNAIESYIKVTNEQPTDSLTALTKARDANKITSSEYKNYLNNVFSGTYIYTYTESNEQLKPELVDNSKIKQYYIQVENQAYSAVTRKYYRRDENGTYIQTNVSKVGGDTTVVANLYDQNHQALDIQSYPITWTWLTPAQELFTIEENTYNSIILQQKSYNEPQNAMKQICILQASLTFGETELTAYLPIPLRNNYAPVKFEGPTKIIYSTTGTPNYYKDAMKLYYNNEDGALTEYPVDGSNKFSIYTSANSLTLFPTVNVEEKNDGTYEATLQAKSLYIDGINPFAIQYEYKGTVLWTQPILYMQNRYFSSTLNKWDGELNVDDETNTILAKSIAAGKKNSDNTFSGVIIGDWTDKTNANDSGQYVNSISDSNTTVLNDTTHTALGIYGINKGATSFGFTENGTGFIGKSGNGRIIFDGDNSLITSGNWFNNREGLYFDIDDGFILAQNGKGQYVKINAKASYDTDILKDSSYVGDNFSSNFKQPKAIPKAGVDKDGNSEDDDYPFVIRGDDDNYTKIGWKGDLVLHGTYKEYTPGNKFNDITITTDPNGEKTKTYNFSKYTWYKKDEDNNTYTKTEVQITTENYTEYYFDKISNSNGNGNYGISLSASARTYPLNIADHFATMWDGSLIISANKISEKYGAEGKRTKQYTNVYGRGETTQTIDTNIVTWEDLSGLDVNSSNLGDDEEEAKKETVYTIVAEGLKTAYKKRYNYTNRENQLNGETLVKGCIYGYTENTSDGSTYGNITNEVSIADSTSAKFSDMRSARNSNSYDYSQLNENFEGFYATPYGDLYLSKKLVIGNNFSATRDGYLKATNALFDDCNADVFNIVYTDIYGRDANSKLYNTNNITKKQYMSLVYGNPYYTPLAGRVGIVRGYNGFEENNTLNVGIETKNDFGIKLNSNTNISISARKKKITDPVRGATVNDTKLFSPTGEMSAGAAGGIYLDGRKLEVNTSQEIKLITTYDNVCLEDYYNEKSNELAGSHYNNASDFQSLPLTEINTDFLKLLEGLNISLQSDNFINAQSIGLKYEAGKYQTSGERTKYNSYPVDEEVIQSIYNTTESLTDKLKNNTNYFCYRRNINGYLGFIEGSGTTKGTIDIDTSINVIPGYIRLKAGEYAINLRGYENLYNNDTFTKDNGIDPALSDRYHSSEYTSENLTLGGNSSYLSFLCDDEGKEDDSENTSDGILRNTIKVQTEQLLGEIKDSSGVARINLGVYGKPESGQGLYNVTKGYLRIDSSGSTLYNGTQVILEQGGDGGTNHIRLLPKDFIVEDNTKRTYKSIEIQSANSLITLNTTADSMKVITCSTPGIVMRSNGFIKMWGKEGIGLTGGCLESDIAPKNQHGIYARFA